MRILSLLLALTILSGCLPPVDESTPEAVVVLREPNPGLQAKVAPLSGVVSKEDAAELSGFYSAFADVLEDDGKATPPGSPVVLSCGELRSAHSRSGRLMFATKLKGKYPTLPTLIDEQIKDAIGDKDVPLSQDMRSALVGRLRAIAWVVSR